MTKIYIAASSDPSMRPTVRHWMRMATDAGMTVTHDWLTVVENHPPGDNSIKALRPHANNDLSGVMNAEVVWMLSAGDIKSEGAAFELGFGLATAMWRILSVRRAILSGPSSLVFRALCNIDVYETHGEAFASILRDHTRVSESVSSRDESTGTARTRETL